MRLKWKIIWSALYGTQFVIFWTLAGICFALDTHIHPALGPISEILAAWVFPFILMTGAVISMWTGMITTLPADDKRYRDDAQERLERRFQRYTGRGLK